MLWQAEPDARVLDGDPWSKVGGSRFDPADRFGSYLRALRWGCVTATDPSLFQAPFRAGIQPEPYLRVRSSHSSPARRSTSTSSASSGAAPGTPRA